MNRKRFVIILFIFLFSFSADPVFADELENQRLTNQYDESTFDLMTYADDSWYEIFDKTGTAAASSIKDILWAINVVIAKIALMVIYQLFSLDVVELTKDSVMEIVSGTAGSLLSNFGMFALAIASIGIVVRAYIQQNWQAFFKIVTLLVISLALLFSIQSKQFNYINLAHNISISLENAIMKVNPSLTENSPDLKDFNSDIDIGKQVAISIENKAFKALLFKPYLLLQYGSTNVEKINSELEKKGINTVEGETRISAYLNADPFTEEGAEKRREIAKVEYEELKNENIFAGNVFQSSAYIIGIIISTTIQTVVFFFLALIRILLQFAFIFMMLLVPIMLFASLFPSFESIVVKYLKSTFILILFKGVVVFFVLVATSFITLSYDMTALSNDIYYRIFIQIIFSVAIIFMYMKRQFVLSMLEGSSPSIDDMGGRTGMSKKLLKSGKNKIGKGKGNGKVANRKINDSGGKIGKTGVNKTGNSIKSSARKGFDGIKNKTQQAKDYISQVQNGEIPNYENPYQSEGNTQQTGNSQTNGRKPNSVNVNGENVSVKEGTNKEVESSRSMRSPAASPKHSSRSSVKQQAKKQLKTGKKEVSATKSNSIKSNIASSKSDKPITQWEANEQIKDNKSARNPYQNKENREQLKNYESRFKSIQSNKELLQNKRDR